MEEDVEMIDGASSDDEDVFQTGKTTLAAAKRSTEPRLSHQHVAGHPGNVREMEENNTTADADKQKSTLVTQGPTTSELQAATDDETLYEEFSPWKGNSIMISDWSQTGKGSYVDFSYAETVPLVQGRYLGRGATGDVYETIVQGYKLAHKRIVVKRKIGNAELKEIEILKRLSSHKHMMQLVGTYTHRHFLGLLLHPVAVCDLHNFFEDVEAWSNIETTLVSPDARRAALDPLHRDRLEALGYDFPTAASLSQASIAYRKIGCLISAIDYLHEQKIRHKDLKPSNILLSQDRLWLSDFGSATDFSLLSQSATDNYERGTPRYFSPEVASFKPNGRAADIFSLGCVLLEIVVLHDRGTLEHIRQNRSQDPSFHTNLDKVDTWCTTRAKTFSRRHQILQEIKLMLKKDASVRPTAKQLLIRISGYDITSTKRTIFDKCCVGSFVTEQQREHEKRLFETAINKLAAELQEGKMVRDEQQEDYNRMFKNYQESLSRIRELRNLERALRLKNEEVQEQANQLAFDHNRQMSATLAEVQSLRDALLAKDLMLRRSEQAIPNKLTATHSWRNLRLEAAKARERGSEVPIKSREEQLDSRLPVFPLPFPLPYARKEEADEKVAVDVARDESPRPLVLSSNIGSVDDSKQAAGIQIRRKVVRRHSPHPKNLQPLRRRKSSETSDEDGDASSHLSTRATSASQRPQFEVTRNESPVISRRRSSLERRSSKRPDASPNFSEFRDHDHVRSSGHSPIPARVVPLEVLEHRRFIPGFFDVSDAQSDHERRSIDRKRSSRSPSSYDEIPHTRRSGQGASKVVRRQSSFDRLSLARRLSSSSLQSNLSKKSEPEKKSLTKRLGKALGFARK